MDSLLKDVVRKLSLDRGPKFDLREGQKYLSHSLLGAWGLGQLGADDEASFPVCHGMASFKFATEFYCVASKNPSK